MKPQIIPITISASVDHQVLMKGARSAKLPAGKALPSIVALACGMREDGLINVIGTGFGVGTSAIDKNVMLFATCTHVVNELFRIRNLKENEGKQEGLIDNRCRIALFEGGRILWKEIEPAIGRYDTIEMHNEQNQETNLTERDDCCIIGIPGIKVPILPLFKSSLSLGKDQISYEIGSEVMIIGFPVFVDHQKNFIMPYVLKTIISSSMPYLFDRNGRKILSPRLALGCIVGSGFSGSPVISMKEGSIVGMIDYTPIETDVIDLKIKKPQLVEGDMRLVYPAGITFAIPSMIIKRDLDIALNPEKILNR